MGRKQDMRTLPGLYRPLEAGHGTEGGEGPVPSESLHVPMSSWEELSPQADASVLSARADSSFHLLSTADNQSRMAVVASPHVRQLKHKEEGQRVSPSRGLNPVSSLPHFPGSWGSRDDSADLALLPSTRQLSALGRGWSLGWRELLPAGVGKGWQEQQDPSADLPCARRRVSGLPVVALVSSSHHLRTVPPQLCEFFSFCSLVKRALPAGSLHPWG